MALLGSSDRDKLRDQLAALPLPVRLVFFTQTLACDTCPQARRILDEIVSLSDRLSIEEHNLLLDRDKAAEFGVDRAPAIAVLGESDYGIRFYGAPAGYEFASLIEAIDLVASGDAGLSEASLELVAGVDRPLALQVFVTPT